MKCTPMMSLLEAPVTYLFGVMFGVTSMLSVTANFVVLFMLAAYLDKTNSNKILTSLVVADLLTGLVVSPLYSWQLLDISAASNCEVKVIGSFLTLVLIGSSYFTLALITYDRFILLTRLHNYSLYMPRRKVVFLIIFAWSFPATMTLLRYAGTSQCLLISSAIFAGVFLSLITGYVKIVGALQEKEKKLHSHQSHPIFIISSRRQNKNKMANEQSQIKVAKSIATLLACHFVCGITFFAWSIIYATNIITPFMSPYVIQILYTVAMLTLTLNSCFNPFIYFAKNPEFRKLLKRNLGI